MLKYYDKKERLSGKERLCGQCSSILSRYSDKNICSLCEARNIKNKTSKIIGDIDSVIKGLEKKPSKKSSRH